MKTIWIVVTAILVLVVANVLIFRKEQTLANGQRMLLKLAPRDPRSLLQGDYMALNYAVNRKLDPAAKSGAVVVRLDDTGVVDTIVRTHNSEALGPGERLLRFHVRNGQAQVGPDAFFFQEGQASVYQRAQYGEFRVDPEGRAVLIGLCGEDRQPLKPDAEAGKTP